MAGRLFDYFRLGVEVDLNDFTHKPSIDTRLAERS